MEAITVQKITKDMTIGEVVQKYPSAVDVLQEAGVHCVGCGASYDETIEEGLTSHGFTEEEVARVVEKLNESIPEEFGSEKELIVTDRAVKKLKQILKEKGKEGYGLQVSVTPGGCAGYSYEFSLQAEPRESDTVIDIKEVRFFVDAAGMEKLQGARIDYLDTLTGAGFRISNPHAKKTCGCGQSFR